MAEIKPIGCNALREVIQVGYLQIINYYTESEGTATGQMVTFPDAELLGLPEDTPGYNFNFCPFCGTRMLNGKPQCDELQGDRKERELGVVIE